MSYFNGSPLDDPVSLLMIQMLMILLMPRILYAGLKHLHQPLVVAEILSGIIFSKFSHTCRHSIRAQCTREHPRFFENNLPKDFPAFSLRYRSVRSRTLSIYGGVKFRHCQSTS